MAGMNIFTIMDCFLFPVVELSKEPKWQVATYYRAYPNIKMFES